MASRARIGKIRKGIEKIVTFIAKIMTNPSKEIDLVKCLERLEIKIDTNHQENQEEFKAVNQILSKIESERLPKIETTQAEIKVQIINIEKSLIKLEEKIAGLDKRLFIEETYSRTTFAAIIGGVAIAVVKFLFFT